MKRTIFTIVLATAAMVVQAQEWFKTDSVTLQGRIEGYDAEQFGFTSMSCLYDDVFEKEDGDEREGESDGDDERIPNRIFLFDLPEKEGKKTIDSKDDSRSDEESRDLEIIIENVVSIDES